MGLGEPPLSNTELYVLRQLLASLRCNCGRNYIQALQDRGLNCGGSHSLEISRPGVQIRSIAAMVNRRLTEKK